MRRGLGTALWLAAVLAACRTTPEPMPVPAIAWAPKHYACARATTPPVLDGRLDDPCWRAVPWTDDFVDIEGSARPRPRFRTRAKMLWDGGHLYIAAELEEPDVRATFTKRDSYIYQEDDDFEVFLDPDGDTHRYAELEINARGTEWDLLLERPYRDGGPAVDAWNCAGLRTAVHVDGTLNDPSDRDRGWTVEIAFPWTGLEATGLEGAPEIGDVWRVNLTRVEWRKEVVDGVSVRARNPATGKPFREDNWVWSPQGVVAMHYPEMWGFVTFVERADDAASFEPGPVERARWALRLVDYRQREHRRIHRQYAAGVEALGLDDPPIAGVPWPPSIAVRPKGYEAVLRLPDGREVRITQDGRVR